MYVGGQLVARNVVVNYEQDQLVVTDEVDLRLRFSSVEVGRMSAKTLAFTAIDGSGKVVKIVAFQRKQDCGCNS